MTLAGLKSKAEAVKIGGRKIPDNAMLETYQEMAFDYITQLCSPLNLTISYQDSDIARFVEEDDEGVEWFLKKPVIAKADGDYIDIDSRLDMAFVYAMVSFLATDGDKVLLDQKAERACVEYACNVLGMGLSKAKEVYEEESFITGVRFDCVGKVYEVESAFIDLIFDCLLCGQTCMNAAEAKVLDMYRKYLEGESVRPVDLGRLRAVDIAVFDHVLSSPEILENYSAEQLNKVTSVFCELGTVADSGVVEPWVIETDRRYSLV